MKILVDTCIWSLALRRQKFEDDIYVSELKDLIDGMRAGLIGPIRQELLSGVRSKKQFALLRDKLEPFDDIEIIKGDYELAAEFFNTARSKGIQGSNTDFLICAVSARRQMPIFTMDKDFTSYSSVLPIVLHNFKITNSA